MNRRDFVRAGTVTAGALTARSYARVLGANDRVGLGVIGIGRRGTIVTGAFLRDPRVDLRAVCDIYDAQTNRFLSRLSNNAQRPATYVAYSDLLSRKDIDAVLISTPDHLHVTVATAALAAEKNIYLEKPTLHHWKERKTLLDAAANSKQVLQCGMQQRSGSHYLRVKQEIFEQQKLGKVLFARAVWDDFPWQTRKIINEPKPPGLDWELFLGPAPQVPYETIRYTSWRYFPDYGNGLLADILTHWVDVAQWMLEDSQPKTAASLGGIYQLHDGRQNPDTVSAIIQYATWNLNFESSVLPIRDPLPSVYFEGTKGTLNLSREGYTLTLNDGQATQVASSESLEQAHTRNFIDAVVMGKKVNASLEAGIAASLPVQMALHSYWQHKLVTREELS